MINGDDSGVILVAGDAILTVFWIGFVMIDGSFCFIIDLSVVVGEFCICDVCCILLARLLVRSYGECLLVLVGEVVSVRHCVMRLASRL